MTNSCQTQVSPGAVLPKLRRARRLEISTAALWLVAMLLAAVPQAVACDLCAVYSATEQRASRAGLRLGLAEQFTSYNTLQESGEKVDNPAAQRLESYITQFLVGYNFTPRLGLQINVPVIARTFRRSEAGAVDSGSESGVGDLSVVGTFVPFIRVTEHSIVRFTLLGGLKLPSGNSRRIEEELQEMAVEAPMLMHDHEHPVGGAPSAVHGHDLALGSGSIDGLIGAQLFASWDRLFVTGSIQYLLRTEGDFDYTCANDLLWSAGPGVFVLLSQEYSLGGQLILSGESKGNDTLGSLKMDDTATTSVYMGPGLQLTWGTSLVASFDVDLPLVRNNSALQLVADYRLRGGFTWQF